MSGFDFVDDDGGGGGGATNNNNNNSSSSSSSSNNTMSSSSSSSSISSISSAGSRNRSRCSDGDEPVSPIQPAPPYRTVHVSPRKKTRPTRCNLIDRNRTRFGTRRCWTTAATAS